MRREKIVLVVVSLLCCSAVIVLGGLFGDSRDPTEVRSDVRDLNTGATRTFKLHAGEVKHLNDGQFRIHSIYGVVYADVDGDSEFTDLDKRVGLSGALVQLFDPSGISVERSHSNNVGEWGLFVEPNHDYYIQFSCPPTYVLTFKSHYTCGGEGSVLVDDRTIRTKPFTISLSNGKDIVGHPLLSGCLCYYPAKLEGYVFEDINMNQIRDNSPEEKGIAQIRVQLRYRGFISGTAPSPDEQSVIETRTNDNGHFDFGSRLRPGVYELSYIDVPRNYVPSDYKQDEEQRSLVYSIVLRSGDKKIVDQGFYSLAEVSGVVWEDLNADGVWDYKEPVLANIEVKLIKLPENREIASVHSDESGRYSFTRLPLGEYYVKFMKKSPDFKHSNVDL